MRADGTVGVAVVGEDEVHRALAMGLFDGALAAMAAERGADWLEPATSRTWLVYDGGARERRGYYDSHREDPLPGPVGRRVQPTGFIDGRPAGPGASKLRHLYLLHSLQANPPDVVVLLMDTDGDHELVASAEQIRTFVQRFDSPPLLVIGTPHRDAEGWLFVAPVEPGEATKRLAQARTALSFDPTQQPERLTASPNDAVTDAKRVLRFVVLGEGTELARGRPRSAPPSPAEADELVERLAARLDRAATYEACGLARFVRDLHAAVATTFRDSLPPARP